MKFRPIFIIIIAFALSIGILDYAYVMRYSPDMQQAKNQAAYGDDLATELGKKTRVQQRVKDAEKMVADKVAEWRAIVATNTPPTSLKDGGIDLSVPPEQLIFDARTYRNHLQSRINEQLKYGGIKILTGPTLPVPGESQQAVLTQFFNFPTIAFPVVILDLGNITVNGTYEQIMKHVRGWKNFKGYMAQATRLTLNGTSPHLVATYNLQIVGFIRSKDIYPGPPNVSLASFAATAPKATTPGKPGAPTTQPAPTKPVPGKPVTQGKPGGPGGATSKPAPTPPNQKPAVAPPAKGKQPPAGPAGKVGKTPGGPGGKP
ncbi:MAG: hypothetical protein JSS72_05250 [Armatimonadetes bacterium]|nr:hypothetical protein [Armatimonadota bacterium]